MLSMRVCTNAKFSSLVLCQSELLLKIAGGCVTPVRVIHSLIVIHQYRQQNETEIRNTPILTAIYHTHKSWRHVL